MKQFDTTPRPAWGAPVVKPLIETFFMRMLRNNCWREEHALALFIEAVRNHVDGASCTTMRGSYRQLQQVVRSECGPLAALPSEATFRRHVKNERARCHGDASSTTGHR